MSNNRRFNIALISAIFSWSVAARNSPTWPEGRMCPADWAGDSRVLQDIPQYVLDYAPLVHLNSKEYFWPSDMSEHLEHVQTYVNETRVADQSSVCDLGELNNLDGLSGRWVYLESNDYIDMWKDANIKDLPPWLTGKHNIPVAPADGAKVQTQAVLEDLPAWDEDFHIWHKVGPKASSSPEELLPATNERRSGEPIKTPSVGGRSSAPAVLLVVEKDNGVVDAFWFFFYSYNLGNSVFTFRFGNHVGDWEHATMRFYNGVPKVMFLSEHEGGKGFTYHAAEKYGKRVRPQNLPSPIHRLTDFPARSILRIRHPCDVPHTRNPRLRPPLPHPPGPNRQRPSLGSPPEHIFLPLQHHRSRRHRPHHPLAPRPPSQHPHALFFDPGRPYLLVLLWRPLGRQILPSLRPPPIPTRQRKSIRLGPLRATPQSPRATRCLPAR